MKKNIFRTAAITLIAFIFGLSVISCNRNAQSPSFSSSQESQTGIINGRAVKNDDAFRVYTVGLGPQEEPVCTGVIINENFVITAAHCVEDIRGTYVHFGLDFTSVKSLRRKILQVIGFPKYCPQCTEQEGLQNTGDIAIVKFEGNTPPGFQPVKIANPQEVKIGALVTLAGYGENEHGKYETILKTTSVPLSEFSATEFSTNETRSGSCAGDSGGPAYIAINGEYQLLGITSRGDIRCRKEGIYTLVQPYEDWLLDIMTTPENH